MPEPAQASPFSRILACIAVSPHAPEVVREAAWLAGLCGGELAFVHAGDDEELVRRTLSEALGPGAGPPHLIARRGGPERVILAEAEAWGADLIFAGAVANAPLLRGVLGSVARRLARHADRSVYLSLHRAGEPTLDSMAIAMNFDDDSRAAAQIGLGLARRASARAVHIVHEYDPRARGAIDSVLAGSDQARYEQMVSGAQRFQLADAVQELDLGGISPRLACIEGQDLVQTTAYASDVGADLLVLAAPHQRIGLLDRFFGDPTETVLQRFPCSVLLVRRPGGPRPPRG
ncbi:MAG TPA: universal stress protein [Phycisphaerales bacterium]|nr:universal stress protein [Phycisphaerales bacterium]